VVFLCKNKSIKTIRMIKDAGATDYLTKPFLPLELMEVLQGVVLKQG
jgi:DNA-binding response OmpR family regulator